MCFFPLLAGFRTVNAGRGKVFRDESLQIGKWPWIKQNSYRMRVVAMLPSSRPALLVTSVSLPPTPCPLPPNPHAPLQRHKLHLFSPAAQTPTFLTPALTPCLRDLRERIFPATPTPNLMRLGPDPIRSDPIRKCTWIALSTCAIEASSAGQGGRV